MRARVQVREWKGTFAAGVCGEAVTLGSLELGHRIEHEVHFMGGDRRMKKANGRLCCKKDGGECVCVCVLCSLLFTPRVWLVKKVWPINTWVCFLGAPPPKKEERGFHFHFLFEQTNKNKQQTTNRCQLQKRQTQTVWFSAKRVRYAQVSGTKCVYQMPLAGARCRLSE